MKFKQFAALALSFTMLLGLAACGGNGAAQGDGGSAKEGETKAEPALDGDEYIPVPGEGAKYTVEVTDDNWVLLKNEGGETLGLSKKSGVHIIEDEGFAFKDMNQNGQLDTYEDWRQDTDARVADLLSQMKGEEKAAILSHGGWGDFTTDPLTKDDGSYTYLIAGGRGGVTRQIGRGGADHAKWTNAIQEAAESCYYGIPAMISIDPANISGLIESVSLGSTMDSELAAKIGEETSKQYRAAGVTALLGPQVDIASPIMSRSGGTYGEDPQLTKDIAVAYVNAMQSTYDESGADQGWGNESVYCFTKHFAGAGATEGGRDDHLNIGRYAVFPGNNFEAHLITYIDGIFKLPGATGSSGIMTEYAVNVDGEGKPFSKEEYAGAYNDFQYGILNEVGYDSLMITDWGVFGDFGPGLYGDWATGVWGTEDMPQEDRIALCWKLGGNLLGGLGDQEVVGKAYTSLVNSEGQEGADAIMDRAEGNFLTVMMNLGMFENPYSDSAYAASIIASDEANAFGLDTQRKSVVMIKNAGNIIKEGGNGTDKPKVYVPYIYSTNESINFFAGVSGPNPTWTPGMDLEILGKYFDVVTDTLGDPTGEEDEEGNKSYNKEDLTRASKEDIASCDYILVGMKGAYTMSSSNHTVGVFAQGEPDTDPEEYYPASLQYKQYTAKDARKPSISGRIGEDGKKEDRSYQGNSTKGDDTNYGSLEALEYAKSVAGDIPVIASVVMERGMVWSEAEPLADVILVNYNKMYDDVVSEIVLGQTEPTGLLVFQQPASMEVVEKQVDDVPRDMKCYKDSEGNTYDFAFGMNWAGVIKDERVSKYSAKPLTKTEGFDLKRYVENY